MCAQGRSTVERPKTPRVDKPQWPGRLASRAQSPYALTDYPNMRGAMTEPTSPPSTLDLTAHTPMMAQYMLELGLRTFCENCAQTYAACKTDHC